MAFFFVMRGMASFFVTRGMAFFFRYEGYGLLFSLYLTFSRVKGHLKAPILLEGIFLLMIKSRSEPLQSQ